MADLLFVQMAHSAAAGLGAGAGKSLSHIFQYILMHLHRNLGMALGGGLVRKIL